MSTFAWMILLLGVLGVLLGTVLGYLLAKVHSNLKRPVI